MKKFQLRVSAAILVIAGVMALASCCNEGSCCNNGKGDKECCKCENCKCCNECEAPAEVVTEEMFRTSKSWDGADLPDYFEGRPELVAMKYVIPAGKKLGWHHHDALNYGVLVQGELTIIDVDGNTKVVHEGEALVEMVGTVHHGENRGDKTVVLYMFYSSKEGLPLSVAHPEIPLE